MKTTVYIDVLVLINLYITYMLLKATFRILNIKPARKNLVFASVLGGLYSLIILFDLSLPELIIIRLFTGVSLVMVSFGKRRAALILKASIVFYAVNFVFGGFIILVLTFFPASGTSYKNGALYFDVSAFTLLVSTTAAYLIINGVSLILNSRSKTDETKEVKISLNGRETVVTALLDTGNKLVDIFSGLPVMVCEAGALNGMLPFGFFEKSKEGSVNCSFHAKGFRVIPVETVGGKNLLPAFKCDFIEISGEKSNAVIALTDKPLSDGGFNAILNTNLLQRRN